MNDDTQEDWEELTEELPGGLCMIQAAVPEKQMDLLERLSEETGIHVGFLVLIALGTGCGFLSALHDSAGKSLGDMHALSMQSMDEYVGRFVPPDVAAKLAMMALTSEKAKH